MRLSVISLVWILYTVSSLPTLRSSSECSVHPCTHLSSVNCLSNEGICFDFQSNNGTSFCAPASSCELLDPCDDNGQCTSNTSICIVNSCCAQPVCLPLILVDLCSSNGGTKKGMNVYTTTTGFSMTSAPTSTEIQESVITNNSSTTKSPLRLLTSTKNDSSNEFRYQYKTIKKLKSSPNFPPKICPEAYWNITGTTVASFPGITPKDFFINQYHEIYIPDDKNHLIRKYFFGNASNWVTAIESSLLHDPTAIFIDLNDNIYIWDSTTYRIYFWSSADGSIRTILSFDGCKESVHFNETCFGKSLFVDSNNSIYVSESTKNYSHANRVMKFEVNSTIGRVIAGTFTYGSGNKQLNSPGTILVNSEGILFVADIDNSRIQQFVPRDRNGTTVVSVDGLTDFIMDQDDHFYVTIKSENLVKRMKKKSADSTASNIIAFLNQPTRLHFGIDGSIYVLNEGTKNIQKFQIMNNIC